LGLLDPDPDPLVRGMDLDPSIIKQQIVRKTLIPADLCLFWTVKNYVNVPSKVISRKNCVKNYFVAGILDVNDAEPQILIRIHPKMSWIRNTA